VRHTKSSNNSGEEVVESIRRGDKDVHKQEHVKLDVDDSKLETNPDSRLLMNLDSVIKDTGSSDFAHILSHVSHSTAGRRFRIVRQNEVSCDGKESTHSTLEDEKPLPACQAHRTIETTKDSSCNETRKGLGEYETRV
jgi:hypothetical protein